MNVPWTSLSTSPVIVNLDGLYVILGIHNNNHQNFYLEP